MTVISFEKTTRQMTRAKGIADTALESTDDKFIALRVFAPEMISAADSYLAADSLVEKLYRRLPAEFKESKAAIDILSKLYDEIRPIAKAKAHFAGFAATTYATDDDYLEAAEDLENTLLEHEAEDWAKELLPKLSEILDATSKEYADLVTIRRELQKAQNKRADESVFAREVLVPFRRIVRATFGSTSREYHDIKDPYRGGDEDTPQGPEILHA